MASELTVQTISSDGIVLSSPGAADAAGNYFTNTGREWIEITNGGASPVVVTIQTYGTYNVGAKAYLIEDPEHTVAAAATKGIGPFDRTLYNDPATNRVNITYDGVTSVTVKVKGLGTS